MPFRESHREQSFVLPPVVDQWIAPDHPARFVWSFVESLDLPKLGIETREPIEGAPPYPPREMLACWIYGFFDGLRSTRKLERACRESLPYLWLMGLLQPDHVSLWRFYAQYRQVMRQLFRQTVTLAIEQSMVDFVVQSIDGSKVPVASNDGLRSQEAIDKLLAKVSEQIEALEAEEERVCQDDKDEPPDQRAQRHRALAKKVDQQGRLFEAQERITEQKQRKGPKPKKIVAAVTDPESRVMKTRHGWALAYNTQIAVDGKKQIIITSEVTQQNYDSDQLIPLLELQRQELGRLADTTLADNGYFSARNVQYANGSTDFYAPDKGNEKRVQKGGAYCNSKFIYVKEEDVFICPQGNLLRHKGATKRKNWSESGRLYRCDDCSDCSARDQCTRGKHGRTQLRWPEQYILEDYRAKLGTDQAVAWIKRRPQMVEPVFGIIKEQLGGRRFLMRRLEKVRQEWFLLCAAYNLRKLYQNWAAGLATAV